MSLYVQHGYGKSDKIEKGIIDNSIKGVILSPKSEKSLKLKEFIDKLKNKNADIDILFDPQFYVASLDMEKKIGHLNEYSFFPSDTINKNFLSKPKNIQTIISNYFNYQKSLGLNRFLSPSIILDSFDSRWSQISLSLNNEAIEQFFKYGEPKNLILSICVDENAFKDLNNIKDFLDIISLYEIKGFYIIIDRLNSNNPQIIDSDILANIMYFCYNLSTLNNFEVILGYTNYIGIPLYCTGISTISNGWFNTLRRFSRIDYIPRDGGSHANKRYFSNKLLNSLLINPEIMTVEKQGNLSSVLSETKYDQILLSNLSGENWTNSINCLHNWESLSRILTNIDDKKSITAKIQFVYKLISEAILINEKYTENYFETKYTHLSSWLNALNEFNERIK